MSLYYRKTVSLSLSLSLSFPHIIPVHAMKAHKETRITAALLLNLGIDGYEWEFPHS